MNKDKKYNYRTAKCCYTCENYKQEDHERFGDCSVLDITVDDTGLCDIHDDFGDVSTEGNEREI